MSKIGHASLGSNGKTTGDKSGDQGREVVTTSWMKKNWSYVLRAKDSNIAELMSKACEAGCANQCVGYNQTRRNSLKAQAKLVGMDLSRIKTDCDCDNQYYNKQISYYQKIIKQMNNLDYSNRMYLITNKRNFKINDYLHKASRYIINYAKRNNISIIINKYLIIKKLLNK